MKVILCSDVAKLGRAGDLVTVADGYGRNYLLPKGFALIATKGNRKSIEDLKKTLMLKEQKVVDGFEKIAQNIEKLFFRFPCKVGQKDQMFGSVTILDLQRSLKEQGFDFEKKQIKMEAPLNVLGEYFVEVHLHARVFAKLRIELFKEDSTESTKE